MSVAENTTGELNSSSATQSMVDDIYSSVVDFAWRFDYNSDHEKLENLYTKAKQNQWDSDVQLNWDHEVDPSKPLMGGQDSIYAQLSFFKKLNKSQQETFMAHTTAQLLSQFLHGEQGALMTSALITHAVPDNGAKFYAATQTMDEARHVEVYAKYCDKIAIVYPMSKWLKLLIDQTLQSDKYQKVMIGMNMIVEGLALGAFNNMYQTTSCPLLKDLTFNVLRDEARHVSFGHYFLGSTLMDMHEDEREECADFAYEAVMHMLSTRNNGSSEENTDPGFLMVLDNAEVDREDFFKSVREAIGDGANFQDAPPGQIHSVKDLMMPALARVGLITKRTTAKYEEAGIPIWDDISVLAAMEAVGEDPNNYSNPADARAD
jgi:para-aminobenzoate N-oxygenase AurF